MPTPPILFDQPLRDRRRRRALARPLEGADFLYRAAAEDIADRLATVQRRFALAAEIDSRFPVLAGNPQVDRIVRMDRIADTAPDIVGDAERLPFAAGSLDLAVAPLSLHWANDLPGTLAQIRRALKPDGLFLAAILGGETLTELRQAFAIAEAEITGGAAPRVAPFAEIRVAGALLQRAGFALPVIDQDRRTVRYDSAFALMRDLRATGDTSVLIERERRPLGRRVLLRMGEVYAERFSDPDGRVRATFDIISLSGWAPHESQPKPLSPGSAKTRLADALGTIETSAGEKPGR